MSGGPGPGRGVRTGSTAAPTLTALTLTALIGLLPAHGSAQQYIEPIPGRADVRSGDELRAHREAARLLGIPLLDDAWRADRAEPHLVEGARAVLVVLARFADTPPSSVSAAEVRERMFTGGRTLADFYESQSGGTFTVTGDVSGWLQSDVSLQDGAGSRNGHGWVGDSLRVHVVRILEQLDPTVDFGAYDNDGPDGIPDSGDDDGNVDLLSIKFAEVAGHCGGPGPWPHFGGVTVDGRPFASNDLGAGGQPIRVPVYIIDSVVECDGVTPQGIGVAAHELGHLIGLPDYYWWEAGPEAENRYWTAGCFDLMAAGAWGCGGGPLPPDGFGPVGFSAFSLWTVGWAQLEDVEVADDASFSLSPLATSRRALRVRLAPQSDESWIIEYRTRQGFDEPLPADGVLIFHRDPFEGPRATEPGSPRPFRYHLVEADGDDALRKVAAAGGNRGVAEDVFARSGPSGPLGPNTLPSTRDHLGGESTLRIHEITRTEVAATVRLSVGSGFRVSTFDVPSSVTVLQAFTGAFELAGGEAPYVLAERLGTLPEGVAVTVEGSRVLLAGTPEVAGTFGTSLWIEDQGGRSVARAVTLRVDDDPSLAAETLLRALVIGPDALTPTQKTYLDRSGNADGVFDLGDLRAYVQRTRGG